MIDASKDRLLFQVGVSPEGKLKWGSSLSPADLNLVLDRVKLEITTGQVKTSADAIVPGTKDDLGLLNGMKQRMGLDA